jgi:integrase
MFSEMAKLDVKLPPHCQVKARNGYADVYFSVHPKDRPQGWPATIKLGRTDRMTGLEIAAKAEETFRELNEFRSRAAGINRAGTGSLPDVILKYRQNALWTELSKRTQFDYSFYLKSLEAWSQKNDHPHISALTPPIVVKYLNTFEATPVKQKRMLSVLRILCRVAVMEGLIAANPVTSDIKMKRRKEARRSLALWSQDNIEAFIKQADNAGLSSIGTAALISYETGQRRGDVLKLQKPRDYKDGRFTFAQNKTGKIVSIRTTEQLRRRLDALPAEQLMLVRNENTGNAWQEHVFCHKFREIADDAGLSGHIFMHLRHSAVNNLERAGNTLSQIAAVTGHSRETVQRMIDTHYGVDRDAEMADQAIKNLEDYRGRKK